MKLKLGSRRCGNLVLDTEQLFQNFWQRVGIGSFAWWKQSINGLISVGWQRNESQVAVGRKQHEQRKMLDTLSCWLAKIKHWLWCCTTLIPVKLNRLVKKYVLNKYGKFCVKIFLRYIDIVIFALGYFILTHLVFWFLIQVLFLTVCRLSVLPVNGDQI